MKTVYIIILSALLLLVMANNIPHGASLYEQIATADFANVPAYWHGFAVMVLFDVCVIVMIFCSDSIVSIALAVLLFFANCFYWNVPEGFANAYENTVTDWKLLAWKVLLSGFFSFLLHRLSLELQKQTDNSERESLFKVWKAVESDIENLQNSPPEITATYIAKKDEHHCPHCERSFANRNKLNAHLKVHKPK